MIDRSRWDVSLRRQLSRSDERASSFLVRIRGRCYGIEFEGTVDPKVRERGGQREGRFGTNDEISLVGMILRVDC
jgi:hypothetical protein